MTDQYSPPQSYVDDTNRSSASGITTTMLDSMRGTKPWVLLIGILLVIFAIFMLIATLGLVTTIGMVGSEKMGMQTGMLIGIAAGYGIFAIIYLLLGIYLFKYNSAIGRLVQSVSTSDMEDALVSQHKFWRLAGIIAVIMLVVMVLIFIASIAVPIFMANN